ncbi:MAG: protein BatD [Flavobacteriaceae bacterium]|nr:BatD family protein [Bacteroidia bacterium]NNK82678.1 protein BatD [Flavobacteriaceae bacterium]
MKLKIYILAFLLSSIVSAQVSFVAKPSKTNLGVNERLRVDFVMNKDGDNFNSPSFENFTVIGGPNQSISTSWVNGKRSYSKTYSFFLAPKKRGTFQIGQATIEIEGEIYKTNPVSITVTAAVDKPKNPNDPNYIADQNIHLVAEVSKTNPYLNEAITVVYKLYVSPDTGVDNWREIDNPRYNDFWSQNIDVKGLKIQNGTYKGEEYRYVVLRKTVLYPQKTGKLNIEPLALDISVQVPTSNRDIFGRRLMKSVHKTVAAGNRTINVKPLPNQGKPLNFSGAVGRFDFSVKTNKNELKATEALQVDVEVSGKGNLKLFELPKLSLPSSLEVYEPEHKENVSTILSGMKGKISDSYTVVPTYQGKYPIPGISFTYFDLKTEMYKTISSEELLINVIEGPINNAVSNKIPSINKQSVITSGNQFLAFKTKTEFTSIEQKRFFKSKSFWASLLLPFLAIPLAIVIRRRKDERDADVVGNKIRLANKLVRKYLGDAKKQLGNKEGFYNALERALHNYLKAKLKIETNEVSKEKITSLLGEKSVETKNVDEFISLLQSCELARYTPFTNVEMQQDYKKASSVISRIDKQIRR